MREKGRVVKGMIVVYTQASLMGCYLIREDGGLVLQNMCMCREEISLVVRFYFCCYSAWFVQEGFASQFQSSNLDELARVYFMSFYVITFVSVWVWVVVWVECGE